MECLIEMVSESLPRLQALIAYWAELKGERDLEEKKGEKNVEKYGRR